MKHLLALLLLPTCLASPSLSAATVYSQGTNPNTYSRSDVDFGGLMADDFLVGSATTVLSVAWQGAYTPDGIAPSPDDFTIRFYADLAGTPTGAPIATFTVGDNVNRQPAGFSFPAGHTFPVYDYHANLPGGMPVPANTTLWLSIQNDAAGTRHWGWATIFPDGGPTVLNPSRRSSDGGVTWPESWGDNTQTFSLLDTPAIPEPLTPGLLALGSFFGLLRRRRT